MALSLFRRRDVTRDVLIGFAMRHQPLMIDGLFDDQPIRDVTTAAGIISKWGQLGIHVGNYDSQLNSPKNVSITTIADYLKCNVANKTAKPGAILIPSEMIDPLVKVPTSVVNFGTGYMSATRFMAYLANAGEATHLHYDANCLHNLHYQVFGRKRFLLFPEHASKYLAPQAQMSRFYLERFSEAERLKFVDFAGGYACTLEPGDVLFVPA